MDWFNTQFYRDFGYGLLYPQIFPHHKRPTDDSPATARRVGQGQGEELARRSSTDHCIGQATQYLCGDQITIADYFGARIVTAGELIRCDVRGLSRTSSAGSAT